MTDVDTSIYSNLGNPLTQATNAVNLQGAILDQKIKGAQLGAQQTIGNALMHNTMADGSVNTDAFQSELSGSGNPFAQQQGAELAQHLNLQQSINKQEKITADQDAYKQMSNEMLGLQQSGDFSDSNVASFTAKHYGQALMDPNYLNGLGNKTNIMDMHSYLTSMPESQRPAAVANLARTWALKGGNVSAVLPTVPTMAPTGAPATTSPMAAVQHQAPNPTTAGPQGAGTMPPQASDSAQTAPSGGASGTMPTSMDNMSPSASESFIRAAGALPQQALPAPGSSAANMPKMAPAAPSFGPTTPSAAASAPSGGGDLNITGLTPEESTRRTLQTGTNVANSNQITTDANNAKLSMNAAQAAKQIFEQNPNASGLVTSALMHSPMGAQLLGDKTLSDAQRGQKLLQQVANAGGVAGGGLTNLGQEVVNAANPSISNVNKAIEENLDRIIGMQQRTVAKANMWRNYTNQVGLPAATANQAQFEQQFTKIADPQVFQVMNMDKSDRVNYLQKLSPQDHQKFVSTYNTLKQQGAFDEQ